MKKMSQQYYRTSVENYLVSMIPDVAIFLGDDAKDEDEWIRIKFGDSSPGLLSESSISLYCNTKNDDDYLELAILTDKVTEYIQEGDYIPYSEPIPEAPFWEKKMDMQITSVTMSEDMSSFDDTKIKIIDFRIITMNA